MKGGRFKNSERLVWVTLGGSFLLQVWSILAFGSEAVPIIQAGVTAMPILVAIFAGITNWAEVRYPNQQYYSGPMDRRSEDRMMGGE